MSLGINLVKECMEIEKHAYKTASGSKLSSSYENFGKILEPRDGFVRLSSDQYGDIAVDYVGRSTGAKLVRYENPVNGIKEHILACSRFVYRMLFDKNNKSIGTIEFHNFDYPASKGMSYKVLEPAADGHTMEILPDGSKKLLADYPKYDGYRGINTFAAMIPDEEGHYIKTFFG